MELINLSGVELLKQKIKALWPVSFRIETDFKIKTMLSSSMGGLNLGIPLKTINCVNSVSAWVKINTLPFVYKGN